MYFRTGSKTLPTPRTIGKFTCTEVKLPGRGGGGHSTLSSVEVADVFGGIHPPTYYAWRGMSWDNLYL